MVDRQDVQNLFDNIQEQDLNECMTVSGITNKDSLVDIECSMMNTFDYTQAFYKNKKLLAIIGYKKIFMDGKQFLFLFALTTKEIVHNHMTYYKEAVKFINKAKKEGLDLLFCTIKTYKESLNMIKRLGFKLYNTIMINNKPFEISVLGVN